LKIREATGADFQDVWDVERRAFSTDSEAVLVKNLLADPTAQPLISLLAYEDGKAVGHILLTKAMLDTSPELPCLILAPLAVVPEFQKRGIGTALMKEALRLAALRGVDRVFVLGHPGYYPRAGFRNDAEALGFEAPYPIPAKHKAAWMVAELLPGTIGKVRGKVRVADTLMKPEYWRE